MTRCAIILATLTLLACQEVTPLEVEHRAWALSSAHVAMGLDPIPGSDLGTGAGVILAVIDTGIDVEHPAFLNPDGTTRVRYLLDLDSPPRPEAPEDIDAHGGALYTADDINAHLRGETLSFLHRDTAGHGTLVASLAASSLHKSPDGSMQGLASEANLIIVKASVGDRLALRNERVIAGLRFVEERAAALDMPWVANLSLNAPGGPANGTDPLEAQLSGFAGPDLPGRAIIVSAGNRGARDVFASLHLDGNATLPLVHEGSGFILTLSTPGSLERVVLEGPTGTLVLEPGDQASLEGRYVASFSREGRVLWSVNQDEAGDYRVQLRGHGPVDATVVPADALTQAHFTAFIALDEQLDLPATAEHVVVVGAFSPHTGEIASFSAAGPTRDGRPLPDVVAPGVELLGARSKHASLLTGDTHTLVSGTSAAAPFAAATATLLLQRNPELDVESLRDILRASARTDAWTGNIAWRPRWGFGKLAPSNALTLLEPATAQLDPESTQASVLTAYPEGRLHLVLRARSREHRPARLQDVVLHLEEHTLAIESLEISPRGLAYVTASMPNLVPGSYALDIEVDGQTLSTRPPVLIPAPPVDEARCATSPLRAPGGPPPWQPIPLLVLLGVVRCLPRSPAWRKSNDKPAPDAGRLKRP